MLHPYPYTEEMIKKLSEYAKSITPLARPCYRLVHPEMDIPYGSLPIKINQYIVHDPMLLRPNHWSIFIPTSATPHFGNHYQLAGESPVYITESTITNYSYIRGRHARGSHTVGYVMPAMLPALEAHFAEVSVGNPWHGDYNSQHWVCNALKGLDHPHMFAFQMTIQQMQRQMAIVQGAWEDEFFGTD